MTWIRPEQRPIVDWPEGRDWRCTATTSGLADCTTAGTDCACNGELVPVPCGYVRPESEGKDPSDPEYGCPECGGPLSRIVVQL